jgi:hypothetical protein
VAGGHKISPAAFLFGKFPSGMIHAVYIRPFYRTVFLPPCRRLFKKIKILSDKIPYV